MKYKITNLVFLLTLLYFFDSQAQVINSFSPSSGPPGTMVTIQGTFQIDNTMNVSIGGQVAILISYSTESIVAYVMPGATTGPVKVNTVSSSASSPSDFIVNVPPFPNTQLGDKLLVSDNIGNAGAGRSVAISADGNTAIVGASVDNLRQGAAWIFVRQGNIWK